MTGLNGRRAGVSPLSGDSTLYEGLSPFQRRSIARMALRSKPVIPDGKAK